MEQVGEYCLHVLDSGLELRFDGLRSLRLDDDRPWKEVLSIFREADLPVHHIKVFEEFEETSIVAVKIYGGTTPDGDPCFLQIIHPKPHGRGWVLHYDRSDKFQTFRRPLPDPRTQRRVTAENIRRELAEAR